MARRKNRVTKLSINEVSLVDSPANPAARVVLAKRAKPMADSLLSTDVKPGDDVDLSNAYGDGDDDDEQVCPDCGGIIRNGVCQSCGYKSVSKSYDLAVDALEKSVRSILADPDVDKPAMLAETYEQFNKFIASLEDNDENSDEEPLTKQDNTMADNKNEPVVKGLTPEQDEQVKQLVAKALEAAQTDLAKRFEKTEKELGEAKAEIAKRDRLAKARTMVGRTATDPEKLASVLEKLGDDKETTDFIADLIAKYGKSIEAGKLLKDLGAEVFEDADDSDPETQVQKAVDEIRKSNPKMTYHQAYAEALSRNPELYARLNEIGSDDE